MGPSYAGRLVINKARFIYNVIYCFDFFLCSFLYLHKETNQRKCRRSLIPLAAECPALLETTGSLETRFAQTCQTPISVVSLGLSGVKRRLKTFYYCNNTKYRGGCYFQLVISIHSYISRKVSSLFRTVQPSFSTTIIFSNRTPPQPGI